MARVVICPSCQSKGSVPDNAAAARIRCPKCGHAFDVSAATGPATSQSQSQMRNPAAPKRPKPTASAYQDGRGGAVAGSLVQFWRPAFGATARGQPGDESDTFDLCSAGSRRRGRGFAERLDRRAVARRRIGRSPGR